MRRATITKLIALFIPLIFAVTDAGADGVCGATSANSYTFNEVNNTATWSGFLNDTNTTDYYFAISQPGTLHIEFDNNPAGKMFLAHSTNSCPLPGVLSTSFNTSYDVHSDPYSLPYAINLKAWTDVANGSNYTFTATFTPSPIGVSKNNYPKQIKNGTSTDVEYTLTAFNYSGVAGPLRLVDTLPAEVNISTVTIKDKPWNWTCNIPLTTHTLECNISNPTSTMNGETLTFTAAVQPNVPVNQTPYAITNTVQLISTSPSYTADGQSTVEAVDGSNDVDLEIEKFAEADQIPAGTPFKYAIFVSNRGNKDAYMIHIKDYFPSDKVDILGYDTTRGWTCPTLASPLNPVTDFNCTYDSTLSSQEIAVLIINAQTHSDLTNGTEVFNKADVHALNDIDGDHNVTSTAKFTIGISSGTIIAGVYPYNGNVDASDVTLAATGADRSGAYLQTRVASTDSGTNPPISAYFFNDNNVTADYDEPYPNAVPLTIMFFLGYENSQHQCVELPDNRLTYDPAAPKVIAQFTQKYPHNARATNTFQMRNIALKNARLVMKYIDINGLLDLKNETCANSNMSSNLAGIPQCFNSGTSTKLDNNKYINVFGIDTYVRCIISNGSPCDPNNHGKSCDGVSDGSCLGYNPEYDHDYGCYECTVGGSGSCSKDMFAIRPKSFDSNITNLASGGAPLRAGKEYSLYFRAQTAINAEPTNDYNETEDVFSDYNVTVYVDSNVSKNNNGCQNEDANLSPAVNFGNGQVIGDYKFTDIGDVRFSIHEKPKNEFAIIDENDTSWANRHIEDFNTTFTVIPDHFNVEGNLTDSSTDETFTYMYDMNLYDKYDASSATLGIYINAVGEDNNITYNYTKDCYANPTKVTLNIQGTQIVPANSITQFLYYNPAEANGTTDSGEGNYTLPQGVAITSLPINNYIATFGHKSAPDKNGTSGILYKLNFNRKVNQPADPIRLALTSVDVKDDTLPAYPVYGSATTNDTATFLYGRAHSPRYRVNCGTNITGPCISQKLELFFEFYSSDSNLSVRREYASDTQRSKDAIMWFRNTHHSNIADGNITYLSHKYLDYNITMTSTPLQITTATVSDPANGISDVYMRYMNTEGYPYKASVELHTQQWLNYDRFNTNADINNTFLIEYNAVGQVIDQDVLPTTDDNASNSNRRIRW